MNLLTSLQFSNVTTIQRDSIPNPNSGDTVYNTDAAEVQTYTGTIWSSVKSLHILDGLRTFVQGAVSINSVLIMNKAALPIVFPVGCPKSQIHALTPPTAEVIMEIATSISPYTSDVTVGTITWGAGLYTPTISLNTQVSQSIGDIVKITTPNDVHGMRGLYVDLVAYSDMPIYT